MFKKFVQELEVRAHVSFPKWASRVVEYGGGMKRFQRSN